MCYKPIQLKKGKDTKSSDSFFMQQVPCGKCLECRKQRINSWYVRLKSELAVSSSAYFVTLTYNDQSIPFNEHEQATLNYEDIQKFFKRLRKRESQQGNEQTIKYYAVGEYGCKTHRPHYHIILFNCMDINNVESSWTLNGAPLGHIHVGNVKDESIYYTLKYTSKAIFGDSTRDNTRQREKALMSKGLGLSYLTPQMEKYHQDDISRGVTFLGNKKLPLPRYYRDKLFDERTRMQRADIIGQKVKDRFDLRCTTLYREKVEFQEQKEFKKLKNTD